MFRSGLYYGYSKTKALVFWYSWPKFVLLKSGDSNSKDRSN